MTGGSVRYTEHAPWLHASTSKCNAAYLYENQTNGPTTGYRALGWAEKVLGAEGAMLLESGSIQYWLKADYWLLNVPF